MVPGRCSLRLGALAVVVAILVVSSAAIADVDVCISDGPPAQTFDVRLLEHHSSPPTRSITPPAEFDRTPQPRVAVTDILSLTALGTSAADYQSPDAHIPPSQAVRQLPAGPGGASLFLLGMGCLGVVKVGKSARHLHPLPEWFHTGGPVQIGHVFVIDMDGQVLVLLPSCYDQSPSDRSAPPSFSYALRPPPHLSAQCFLTSTDTRGPPRSRTDSSTV